MNRQEPTVSKRSQGFLITGSDTEIGKTWCACAIARGLLSRYPKLGVYKPIASGVEEMKESDAYQLWTAAGKPGDGLARVCLQSFREPLAPTIAAEAEERSIDRLQITTGWEYWRDHSDFTLVEGVGGLLSPIAPGMSNADLAAEFQLPLVVVVPNRLGCINQAMMVLEVSRARQLPVAAVLLNSCLSVTCDRSSLTNFALLQDTMLRNQFGSVACSQVAYQQMVIDLSMEPILL